jgi:hypothetical protein
VTLIGDAPPVLIDRMTISEGPVALQLSIMTTIAIVISPFHFPRGGLSNLTLSSTSKYHLRYATYEYI